ncbi:site-specific integrase [Loktanella salsilacus]|nr:site-specific integrase [Loktanella salsilacus]
MKIWTPSTKLSLIFPLRSHVLPEAKALAQKLTLLSDIAFAGVTERTMAIAPDIIDRLLVGLCRFLIEAADALRERAPMRSADVAAYEFACANAAVETLRQAIATRDRDIARNPLRQVAKHLGIALDEADADWQRLAFRALRVMLDAEQENFRRDQGDFDGPCPALKAARSLIDETVDVFIKPVAKHVLTTTDTASSPATVFTETISAPYVAETFAETSTNTSVPPKAVEMANTPQPIGTTSECPSEKDQIKTTCPRIMEGANEYIEQRSLGYIDFNPFEQFNAKSGESWAKNSAPNVLSTARLLSRMCADKQFDQISDRELMSAFELITRVPRSYQAKTSKKTPKEAADEADATEKHNARVKHAQLEKDCASPGRIEYELLKIRIPRLRVNTIYRHMQDFQRICEFIKKRGHLSSSIMENHIWSSRELTRRLILEEHNERLTWCGKLNGLFRSLIFQDELEDKGDPLFWAPLIALHMGLRSEEILQLYLSDIQVIDDIPCIVLRQGPGQSLKSEASHRTVPIHDNLIKLGFMHLVATLERAGEPRLFPWLKRSESKKTYTENFSKRFTKYRKDNKIYDPQRDFHSFRTTFNSLLIEMRCNDTERRALMGHVEHDVGITNYNPGGFSNSIQLENVNSISIDISIIRPPFGDVQSANVTELFSHRTKNTA